MARRVVDWRAARVDAQGKKRMWRHARVWEKKMAIEHKVTSNNSTHRHTNSTMQIIERQCKAQKGSGTRI